MKAIVYSEHGGPEVLKYTDVPEPEIDAYEVVVRVRACALNHLDLFLRRGHSGDQRFRFHTFRAAILPEKWRGLERK